MWLTNVAARFISYGLTAYALANTHTHTYTCTQKYKSQHSQLDQPSATHWRWIKRDSYDIYQQMRIDLFYSILWLKFLSLTVFRPVHPFCCYLFSDCAYINFMHFIWFFSCLVSFFTLKMKIWWPMIHSLLTYTHTQTPNTLLQLSLPQTREKKHIQCNRCVYVYVAIVSDSLHPNRNLIELVSFIFHFNVVVVGAAPVLLLFYSSRLSSCSFALQSNTSCCEI